MSTAIDPVVLTATVGTSSTLIVPVNATRLGLYIFNPSATVPIWICPSQGPQGTGGGNVPAVVNGAGSMLLQPLQGVLWCPPQGPSYTNGVNAICGTPSTPITIWEFYA